MSNMKILRKLFLLLAVCALSANARAAGCDAASGPVINPTPHSVELSPEGERLDVSEGVRIMDRQEAFASDVDFLAKGNKKSVRLEIDFHPKKL